MAVNRKNLRYCQVLHDEITYDVIVAVANLDEVDNILQDWALDVIGEALDLPTELVLNKELKEILTTLDVDKYVYVQSPVAAYMEAPRFAGISGDLPVFPTALNANSKYQLPQAMAFLWSEAGFKGYFGEYIIPQSQEFTLSAGVNYIGIMFNSGSPAWVLYNSFSSFDFSSIIPVVTVFSFASGIYVIPWGQTGYGLPEKALKLFNGKRDIEIVGRYTLTATGRYVQLGALVANNGMAEINCPAVDTENAVHSMYLFYKDASSVWQNTKITQINNSQYQSNSGLASLTAGEYVINNIFRVVDGNGSIIFNVLSGKFSSLQDALNSGDNVVVPDMFKGVAVHVGRVIIGQGASTATIQVLKKNPWGIA